MKNIINSLKKVVSNKRFQGYVKVLGYILSSAFITIVLRRLEVVNLDGETLLLINGLFNLSIYFGKHELDNLRTSDKK